MGPVLWQGTTNAWVASLSIQLCLILPSQCPCVDWGRKHKKPPSTAESPGEINIKINCKILAESLGGLRVCAYLCPGGGGSSWDLGVVCAVLGGGLFSSAELSLRCDCCHDVHTRAGVHN